MLPSDRRALGLLLLCAGAALVPSEYLHWRASAQALPQQSCNREPDAVLVLGYPSGRHGPNAMQRWRTDVAVRSAGAHGRLVFSGGASHAGVPSEAAVMAEDAVRRHGVSASRIILEERAESTWENVALSAPLLANARTIAIASSPLHAARARQYMRAQQPALASRLVRACDYQLGERPLLKLLTVGYNLHPRRLRSAFAPQVAPELASGA